MSVRSVSNRKKPAAGERSGMTRVRACGSRPRPARIAGPPAGGQALATPEAPAVEDPRLIQVGGCGARLPFDPVRPRRSRLATFRLAVERLGRIYQASGPVGQARDRVEAAELRLLVARVWNGPGPALNPDAR